MQAAAATAGALGGGSVVPMAPPPGRNHPPPPPHGLHQHMQQPPVSGPHHHSGGQPVYFAQQPPAGADQGHIIYNQQQQQMHLAAMQQRNFTGPAQGGPPFVQAPMMQFQHGHHPGMAHRSLTGPIQPQFVTPNVAQALVPGHMLPGHPPPSSAAAGPMYSVANPTFQHHNVAMMPPEGVQTSMANEGGMNQADGQPHQGQMIMPPQGYNEMMHYQQTVMHGGMPPTSMSGPPPGVFRSSSQQFGPHPGSMPPGVQPGPAYLPHQQQGQIPPLISRASTGPYPPSNMAAGVAANQFYASGPPQQHFYVQPAVPPTMQQAGQMVPPPQQPMRYPSPGAMSQISQRSISSRGGGRGSYNNSRGSYRNQREHRSISRQTSLNSEAGAATISNSLDDASSNLQHRKGSLALEQASFGMDGLSIDEGNGDEQRTEDTDNKRDGNGMTSSTGRHQQRLAKGGSPRNSSHRNGEQDASMLVHTDTPSTTGACTPEDVTTVASAVHQQTMHMTLHASGNEKTLIASTTIRERTEVAVLDDEKKSNSASLPFCCKCRGLGKPPSDYEGHVLRDPETRKAICPELRSEKCLDCGATGDFAHNKLFCPKKS